jgi:paraquat-inducible protein B
MSAAKPALVGGFVVGALALGVGAVLLFGGARLLSRTVHAVVFFQGSVAGLDVGAPVTFRGVRVGTVTSVAVNLNMTDLTARIPVYLDLNPAQISLESAGPGQSDANFDRLLKAGLRAQLNMQSLITGQLRVDLDLSPGTLPGTDGTEDRPEIPSAPSKLETLEDEIAELPLKQMGEDTQQALAAIRHLTEDLEVKIGPLADSLIDTSAAAHAAIADIDLLAVAGKEQLAVTGGQLGRVLTSSDKTVHDADAFMGSLKEMTAPDSAMRDDLRSAIRDLAASASSMRGFSHEIERDPSVILSGKTGH